MSNLKETNEQHPSYGTIAFRRSFIGGSVPLFGASIQSNNVIALEISEAEIDRHLNDDFIHSKKKIIEVNMSQSQFAELITSMNCGDGIPCTIRYRADKGGYLEGCPYKDKRNMFENEFSDSVRQNQKDFQELEDNVKKILEKKNIGKTDREEIMRSLSNMKIKLFDNQEYIYKQFNEQMDKTVSEAKGEIEAFMQTRLMASAGVPIEGINSTDSIEMKNPINE